MSPPTPPPPGPAPAPGKLTAPRHRLGIAARVLALAVLPMLAVAALAVYAISAGNGLLERTLDDVEARDRRAAAIDRTVAGSKDSILELQQAIAAMIEVHERSLLSADPELADATREKRALVAEALDGFGDNIAALAARIRESALLTEPAPERVDLTTLRRRLGYLDRSRVTLSRLLALVKDANDRTLAALQDGRHGRAVNNFLYEERARLEAFRARLTRMAAMIVGLSAGVEAVQTHHTEAAHAAAKASASDRTRLLFMLLAITVGAVLILAAAFAWYGLTRPFQRMISVMRRLANGDMTAQIPAGRSDELGDMAEALAVFKSYAIEAERASRAKSDFLATVSHEVRTPLNAIMGYAEIIREEIVGPVGSPKYRDYARHIHRSGRHLLDLINDILDLSKVESGRLELTEEPVDLVRVLEEAVALVGPQAGEKNMTLYWDLSALRHRVRGDERALKQILLNLLWNAVKYTPAGGEVRIETASDRGCEVTIRDTGPGIPKAEQEAVFEPFARGRSSQSRNQEGTGIGLALSRHLATLHDAELRLDSEEGAGTAVTLRLPAHRILNDVDREAAASP